MTAIAPAPAFDIGRVISRVFNVLGRNFVTFLLLSVLLVGLPTGAASFLQLWRVLPMMNGAGGGPPDISRVNDMFAPVSIAITLATWLIAAGANAVLQGAVIHGTISDLAGRKATFGECLGAGLRFLLPLIAIGLIAAVCCFFGFLIFLVPGVLLALAWSVAAPVRVMERTTIFGAFARSVELTRDCRGAIFGLAIIAGVTGFIVSMVVGGVTTGGLMASLSNPAGGAFTGMMIAQSIVGLISQTITALLGSTGVASVYYELRQVKEGVGAEQLAAVFD